MPKDTAVKHIVGILDLIKAWLFICKPNISQTMALSRKVNTNNGSKSLFFFDLTNWIACGIREMPEKNSSMVKNKSLSSVNIIPGISSKENGEIMNSSLENPFPPAL